MGEGAAGPGAPGVGRAGAPGVGRAGAPGFGRAGTPGAPGERDLRRAGEVGPGHAGDVRGFLGVNDRPGAAAAGVADAKPFSAEWYAQHPNAFQAAHPHADAAAAWNASSLGRWLTVPIVAGAGGGAVVASTDGSTDAASESTATDNSAPSSADDATNANSGDWMDLGVFLIAFGNQTTGDRMVQLSVSKEGEVRGSYLDVYSDAVTAVSGAVDKSSQKVGWTVGGKTRFETTLTELSGPSKFVTIVTPDGASVKARLAAQSAPPRP